MLFISIVLTIKTEPGYIPDESEWDMPSRVDTEEDAGGPGAAGVVAKANR